MENWQELAVAAIGIVVAALTVRWIVRTVRRKSNPCSGCGGACDGCAFAPKRSENDGKGMR